MKLHDFRQQYGKGHLDENTCPENPLLFFKEWMDAAISFHAFEANACVLSTSSMGRTSSRIVLLKDIDELGLTFFTNYESRKAQDIDRNPNASILFFWPDMERQVRVEGKVEKTSNMVSENYFNSRPFESRVSAAVSPQSKVIESKEILLNAHKAILTSNEAVLRPPFWGGYVLRPDYYEFWQGGAHRIHDRVVYEYYDGKWVKKRLAP